MSIDKHIGAFSHIESKKDPTHEKFDETNANMRKNATSFRPKKHQDENASEASDFFMHPFPDVYQAYGTSNDHEKPIYVSPGGRKKGHQQPLSQAKKNARINQVIFHQIANSRFFLINSRTITFARTNHS